MDRLFLVDLIALKRSGSIDGISRVIEIDGPFRLDDTFLKSRDLLFDLYFLFGKSYSDIANALAHGDFLSVVPQSNMLWLSLGLTYETTSNADIAPPGALVIKAGKITDRLEAVLDQRPKR